MTTRPLASSRTRSVLRPVGAGCSSTCFSAPGPPSICRPAPCCCACCCCCWFWPVVAPSAPLASNRSKTRSLYSCGRHRAGEAPVRSMQLHMCRTATSVAPEHDSYTAEQVPSVKTLPQSRTLAPWVPCPCPLLLQKWPAGCVAAHPGCPGSLRCCRSCLCARQDTIHVVMGNHLNGSVLSGVIMSLNHFFHGPHLLHSSHMP